MLISSVDEDSTKLKYPKLKYVKKKVKILKMNENAFLG